MFMERWQHLVDGFEAPRTQTSLVNMSVTTHKTLRAFNENIEPIVPVNWAPAIPGNFPGGAPSVLLGREALRKAAAAIVESLRECSRSGRCGKQQLYHDLSGSHPRKDVSISPGLREAVVHYVIGAGGEKELAPWYARGAHSYFSESALEMPGWRERYWGENYAKLLAVKKAVDPRNVFWCRHCVGDG